MRIVIFTSNSVRHKYLANELARAADDALVICESKENDILDAANLGRPLTPIEEHFYARYEAEKKFFGGNDYFQAKTMPLLYKEANLRYTHNVVKEFKPDMAFVFGSSILRDLILSAIPAGKFLNLHLGLSPYYRGSGTNFWPFVNKELEFVGSTILHIDAGVDTGDIVAHVTPTFEAGDNVHTVGCKVIKASVVKLIEFMNLVREGRELPRKKQWEVPNPRYYRKKDFNEAILEQYKKNLAEGLVEDYLKNGPKNEIRLIR